MGSDGGFRGYVIDVDGKFFIVVREFVFIFDILFVMLDFGFCSWYYSI